MSTKAELAEALAYIVNLSAGREGGPNPAAQALDILYNHLDDKGDELVQKRKLHEVNALQGAIQKAQERIDELTA